jgi:phosphoribosylaminoimidazole-succinocarboxamide synthase
MLDKENIRQWLIERGFSGEGTPPALTDEIRVSLAERYIELYTQLTGKEFYPLLGDVKTRINNNLEKAGIYA